MDTATLLLLFTSMTQTFELPQGLLSAVCYVESKHKAKAFNKNDGGTASIGICQIKLATARGLGFKGTAEQLQNPKVNIYYAAKYLKAQLKRYRQSIPKGVAAYNAGSHLADKSGVIKNRGYVIKVFIAWVDGR